MPRRLWAILAVAFGVGLSVLDSAIANVALPTIGQELGISSADSIWIVNAYQLAIMVSLLSFSALGELVGYRKVYIGGLMLFTVASVGCALSSSLATLVLARVMQGFGAAAVTSVNTTLIRIIYPKAQLGRGMGINATVVAVSSVAGPTIAAGILSIAHWPWLFAVNIPVGLVALSLSRRFLPDNPVRVGTHRFDWRDAVMNALTFGLLMASVEGFSHGLDPRILSAGIAALLVVGFFFIRSQLREPYPLLPFDLLRIPIFSVSVLTSICSFLGQMLAMVALPFYLQHEFGYDEVATGLLMTAWPAVIMVWPRSPASSSNVSTPDFWAAWDLRPWPRDCSCWPSCPMIRAFRHRMAAGALRRGIRTVPVAQQQHTDRLGPAPAQRKRQRHARHGASGGPDHGRRADGPPVPHRPRKQYPYGAPARGRLRPDGRRRQHHPHPAAAARRTNPAQKITGSISDRNPEEPKQTSLYTPNTDPT